MKKLKYIAMCLPLLLAASCGDWLDVNSKTEVKRDQLFETKAGFRSALTGAYIRLKGEKDYALYSREMIFGTIEMLAQHWVKLNEDYWKKYDYEDSRLSAPLNTIFEEYYRIIMDVNNIIEMSEKNSYVLTDEWYGMIRGEALALRAFCHFELLRLWGPVPGRETTSTILPYVTAVGVENNRHHTYAEYIDFLEDDLIEAERLLAEADPILNYSISALENPGNNSEGFAPDNDYWTSRHIRMNYYAVAGVMARFYLWTGNTDEAYRFAKITIDAKNPNGEPKFRLGSKSDLPPNDKKWDYMFTSEHLFAIRSYEAYKINNTYFRPNGALYYVYDETLKNRIFGEMTDIRYTELWSAVENSLTEKRTVKFQDTEQSQIFQIPVIRLAEMYLIAIETAPLEESLALYSTFCSSRGITPQPVTEKSQFRAIMLKEYNREFYAEGQMFFAYKRFFEKEIINALVQGSDAVYVIPLPVGETKYTE